MADYWVIDGGGGMLGPVSLKVLKDLAMAGRLSGFNQASTDGKTWFKLDQLPEVAQALLPPSLRARREREQQEAQTLALHLDRYGEMQTHELFGVPRGSTSAVYRQGYLELAKRYHPSRLPASVHPELLAASMEMFRFLSARMAQVEKDERRRAPLAPSAPPPPTYAPEEFVGFTASGNKDLEATVQVTPENAGIFYEHRVVNLASGGVFLPCEQPPPLGTALALVFRFADPPRSIRARGVVVLENTQSATKQARGCGIRLERLSGEDKTFLQEYSQRRSPSND